MSQIEAFLVQHVATGKYMPSQMTHGGRRGWSWWEPTISDKAQGIYNTKPRVFYTRQSATIAISNWARGPFGFVQVGNGWDAETKLRPKEPQIPRTFDDLQVIPCVISW